MPPRKRRLQLSDANLHLTHNPAGSLTHQRCSLKLGRAPSWYEAMELADLNRSAFMLCQILNEKVYAKRRRKKKGPEKNHTWDVTRQKCMVAAQGPLINIVNRLEGDGHPLRGCPEAPGGSSHGADSPLTASSPDSNFTLNPKPLFL